MTPSNSQHKSPDRAFALQKYLLLHSQHDALQKNILAISSSVPSSPVNCRSENTSPTRSSRVASLSSSPPDDYLSSSGPPAIHGTSPRDGGRRQRHHHRSSNASQDSSTLSPSQPMSRPRMVKRRSSLPAVMDEDEILTSLFEEEGKLKNVNEQIKCTLTDLLNCEGVRSNVPYRMWVQERLMKCEQELKGERSRGCARRQRRMTDVDSSFDSFGGDPA